MKTHAITNKETLQMILELAKQRNTAIYTAVTIAITTGLRTNDIINLQWCNIDLANKIIDIVETKTKKKKRIAINTRLFDLLTSLDKTSQFVLHNRQGNKISRIYLFNELKLIAEKLGIDRLSMHALRKSFSKGLYLQGVSIVVINNILNHSTIKQTLTYLDIVDSDIEQAYNIELI